MDLVCDFEFEYNFFCLLWSIDFLFNSWFLVVWYFIYWIFIGFIFWDLVVCFFIFYILLILFLVGGKIIILWRIFCGWIWFNILGFFSVFFVFVFFKLYLFDLNLWWDVVNIYLYMLEVLLKCFFDFFCVVDGFLR